MISPVGTPPQWPVRAEPDVYAAVEHALRLPLGAESDTRFRPGSLLTATVRYHQGEMQWLVGDRFFSARPLPGVQLGGSVSLRVMSDRDGQLLLVPLLPLAGGTVTRVGGAGGAQLSSTLDAAPVPPALPPLPVTALAGHLSLPQALLAWLATRRVDARRPAPAATAAEASVPQDAPTLSELIREVALGLANSGLFMESRLRNRLPVPRADLKRQVMEELAADGPQASEHTLAALDDLLRLQCAASLAREAGGSCYSFLLPSASGPGAFWITLYRDPHSDQADPTGQDLPEGEWNIEITCVDLPLGALSVRLRRQGESQLGVTVFTTDRKRIESAKPQLIEGLRTVGLQLGSWAVLDSKLAPEAVGVGCFGQVLA